MITVCQKRMVASRVSRERYLDRQKAGGLMEQARQDAEACLEAARVEVEHLKERAAADVEAYRADAMERVEQEIADFVLAEKETRLAQELERAVALSNILQNDFEAAEVWLIDLVTDCVTSVFGELGEDERYLALIRSGLAKTRSRWKLELHANPGDLDKVEQIVAGHQELCGAFESVTQSEVVPEGELRIAGPGGNRTLGFELQLANLKVALTAPDIVGEDQ